MSLQASLPCLLGFFAAFYSNFVEVQLRCIASDALLRVAAPPALLLTWLCSDIVLLTRSELLT